MLDNLGLGSRGRAIWVRRGASLDEEGMLVLRPTLPYRLQGFAAFLVGCGITFYFSLLFALAKSLAVILGLGVFWAFGVLLFWVGVAMLFDPWMMRFCRPSATVEIIARKSFPLLRKRRLIALEQVESLLLRRTSEGGVFGGGPSYVLELLLLDRERIEIDHAGAALREGLYLLAARVGEFTGKPITEEKGEA